MGGRRNHHTIFGARLFRQHLVEIGVCRSAPAALQHAEPCLVAHFKVWLRKRRGASDSTIRLYARDAAHLMAAAAFDSKIPQVRAQAGRQLLDGSLAAMARAVQEKAANSAARSMSLGIVPCRATTWPRCAAARRYRTAVPAL
jgi:hypothetical protein